MVTKHDKRSMELYLLLLAHSQTTDKKEFFVSLESMALSLGMPDTWTHTALRRQITKSLKKLQHHYNLIDVEFFYGRDAAIRLVSISDEGFSIRSDYIISFDRNLTTRSKFFLLAKAFLETEGEDIANITTRVLAERFSVSESVFYQARKDSKQLKK